MSVTLMLMLVQTEYSICTETYLFPCSAVYIVLIQKAKFAVDVVQIPQSSRKSTYLVQHPTWIKPEFT